MTRDDKTNLEEPGNYMYLAEIKKTCENLISQTQTDLELFKHEQHILRNQIEDILAENKAINTKLEVLKGTTDQIKGDSRDDATREKFSNDALLNVKKQIDSLEAENNELRSLNNSSRKTIQNLENEIQNYRNLLYNSSTVAEIKQKYYTATKLLESTIQTQKTEITKQAQIIENLFQQKKQSNEHLKNLEKALEENQRSLGSADNSGTIEKLKTKLNESTRQTKELQLSLQLAKSAIEERYEREKCALQKVQEALSIAEAAVADKEDAQKREQVVKEECDNLASTIGQVMDEAAKKVEKDMEDLRRKFSGKERSLLEIQVKMEEEIQNQKKFNQILETRCNRFQQKYKTSEKEVDRLTLQLESAVKALDEMEAKISRQDSLLKEQKILMRRANETEQEIQNYIQINKNLKEKYRNTLKDITKNFEGQVYHLQRENAKLKAENQIIQLKKGYNSDGD
ncbi:PREDICTED: M protein, serotype 5 isoform X1 [Rhagoletis zephyria]|uniref:M protein, serotype 5 isoform X1 n=1 Tax=Rhagoletis zephyria TaxID=28612 RepID=UPI00081131F1|nr:PREDICTED: M protein, serotype 5 isoform X1 [Rhagoletis zephyria]